MSLLQRCNEDAPQEVPSSLSRFSVLLIQRVFLSELLYPTASYLQGFLFPYPLPRIFFVDFRERGREENMDWLPPATNPPNLGMCPRN